MLKQKDPKRLRDQRRKILLAAARFIAEQGYHGMSMRALAKATGRSLATAYNYFSSKEEILFALQKEAFETLIAATRQALSGVVPSDARLYILILHHVTYFSKNSDVMRVLVHEAGSLPPEKRLVIRRLKEQYFEIGRRILHELLERGGTVAGASRMPPQDAAELDRITYSLFGMLNWIYGWHDPRAHGGPQELARSIYRLMMRGILDGRPLRGFHDDLHLLIEFLKSPPLIGGAAATRAAI